MTSYILKSLVQFVTLSTVSFQYFTEIRKMSQITIKSLKCAHSESILNMVLKGHQCSQCDYKAKKKKKLYRHIESVHERQKFLCPQCKSTFTQKGGLQRHIKSVHARQKFPCPQCESTFTQKGGLQRHITSVHEGLKFQCAHCESTFTRNWDLQTHMISVHK